MVNAATVAALAVESDVVDDIEGDYSILRLTAG
jgi:hypothetical protein